MGKVPEYLGNKGRDLTGEKYGAWVVLGYAYHLRDSDSRRKKAKARPYWNCRCQCGVEKAVRGSTLVNGESKSCFECFALGKARARPSVDDLRLSAENMTVKEMAKHYACHMRSVHRWLRESEITYVPKRRKKQGKRPPKFRPKRTHPFRLISRPSAKPKVLPPIAVGKEEWLRTHAITKCPARYVAPVQGGVGS